MLKIFITIFFLLVSNCSFSQDKPLTKSEKAALDSMLQDDEFLKMMKTSLKSKSYIELSAGLGNSYFSVKNKSIEASQLESKLVFTPAVTYYHKSGLGLSASAFLSSFNGRTGFYQFSLTPSYSVLKSKKVGATISYTRFFRKEGYTEAASPIQNDIYAYAYLKKPWLQPGISIGLSGGKNTFYKKYDTLLFGARRVFTDTIKTSIKSFSMSAFVKHKFVFLDVLKRDDGISLEPKFILNAGVNRYSEKHYNPYMDFIRRVLQRRKNLGRLQDDTSFELQSIAFNADINYLIGRFGFEPQVYLDYYLPETTDKKFTCVFSFVVSYSF